MSFSSSTLLLAGILSILSFPAFANGEDDCNTVVEKLRRRSNDLYFRKKMAYYGDPDIREFSSLYLSGMANHVKTHAKFHYASPQAGALERLGLHTSTMAVVETEEYLEFIEVSVDEKLFSYPIPLNGQKVYEVFVYNPFRWRGRTTMVSVVFTNGDIVLVQPTGATPVVITGERWDGSTEANPPESPPESGEDSKPLIDLNGARSFVVDHASRKDVFIVDETQTIYGFTFSGADADLDRDGGGPHLSLGSIRLPADAGRIKRIRSLGFRDDRGQWVNDDGVLDVTTEKGFYILRYKVESGDIPNQPLRRLSQAEMLKLISRDEVQDQDPGFWDLVDRHQSGLD